MRTYRRYRKGPRGASIQYPKWWIELRDHDGNPRRFAGFTDREASAELGRKVERLAELRGAGRDPAGDLARYVETMPADLRRKLGAWGILRAERVAAARPLDALVGEWGETMRARAATAEHVARSLRRVRAIAGACGFQTWSDLRPERVESHLRALRERDPVAIEKHLDAMGEMPGFTKAREKKRLGEKGLGAKASNHYLAAAKAFCRWAVERGLAIENPLRVLRPLNSDVDRRHLRRALSEKDLRELLRATRAGRERAGVSGPVRAAVYAFAAESGLRAGEIVALRVVHFDLDGDAPAVTVPAHVSKHRREDRVPLRRRTAAALVGLLEGRGPLEPAFGLSPSWKSKAARILAADLKAAGLPYEDVSGRRFDFHSLRGEQATRLLAHGANPKTVQDLIRHADPHLTMSIYAKTRAGEEHAALDLLPDLIVSDEPEAARATGTDGGASRSAFPAGPDGTARDCAGQGFATGGAYKPSGPRAVVEDRGVEPLTSTDSASPESGSDRKRDDVGADSATTPLGPEPARCAPRCVSGSFTESEGAALSAIATDPDLARLAAAWPTLPPEVRAAILRVAGLDREAPPPADPGPTS